MLFTLTFQFPRDNSISNLENRVEHINSFLKNHTSGTWNHRCFGVQLLHPAEPEMCQRKSVRKFLREHPESVGNQLLGFFFFNAHKEEVGNLTILYDLGKEPSNLRDLSMDVWAVSALCAMSMDKVEFKIQDSTLDICFDCDDADEIYKFLSTHFSMIITSDELIKS